MGGGTFRPVFAAAAGEDGSNFGVIAGMVKASRAPPWVGLSAGLGRMSANVPSGPGRAIVENHAMKTHQIEIQKFKSASNSSHGTVSFKVDALLTARQPVDGIEPSSVLTLTEANARVLMALLKTQLMEFDGRKARSQR